MSERKKNEVQSTTQKSLAKSSSFGKTKVVELPMMMDNKKGDVGVERSMGVGKVEYKELEPVANNKKFAIGIIYLLESDGADYDHIAIWNFTRACEQFDVKCEEMMQAYWKAYADPYVGKEGIQFRHLYKHIEQSRTGGNKILTYHQMLHDMQKRMIPMDSYKQVDELDDNGNKKWVLK